MKAYIREKKNAPISRKAWKQKEEHVIQWLLLLSQFCLSRWLNCCSPLLRHPLCWAAGELNKTHTGNVCTCGFLCSLCLIKEENNTGGCHLAVSHVIWWQRTVSVVCCSRLPGNDSESLAFLQLLSWSWRYPLLRMSCKKKWKKKRRKNTPTEKKCAMNITSKVALLSSRIKSIPFSPYFLEKLSILPLCATPISRFSRAVPVWCF